MSPETVERITAHELSAALSRLPEDQREAVLLCDLWGFRYEQIAEITAVPVGTVRSRLSRARSHLALILSAADKQATRSGERA